MIQRLEKENENLKGEVQRLRYIIDDKSIPNPVHNVFDDVKIGECFAAECIGWNKQGLLAEYAGHSVLVPMDELFQPPYRFYSELEEYKGITLLLKIIKLTSDSQQEIIASQKKAAFEAEAY